MTPIPVTLSRFADLMAEAHTVSAAEECRALAVDGMVPECIVYPSSGEETAAVLKRAAVLGRGVIPCRNGTKLSIGNRPRRYDVALSLKEMNRVWYYEPEDLTVSVEAGMKFGDFQRFLGRQGLWFPLDPDGGERASLGGIVATNATGPLRLGYGAPRDMVLGIKIATTDGKLVKAGGRVVKNVAGYDLVKLLIGSYGTLGVIVEMNLKLFPLPHERATFVISLADLATARDLRRNILQSPLRPLRMALLDRRAGTAVSAMIDRERDVRKFEMWLEAGGTGHVIERYRKELGEQSRRQGAALRELDAGAAETAWKLVADSCVAAAEASPGRTQLKITLPAAKGEELLDRAMKECESERVALASFAQIGVGIIRLCLWPAERSSVGAPLVAKLRKTAESLGGALVIERCALELKTQLDVWGHPGDDWEIMRKLKQAWDPAGILSPGRFVGGL